MHARAGGHHAAPGLRWVMMRDTVPPLAVDGSAMMALPPRDLAARVEIHLAATPEKNFEPMESAHTCPVRSLPARC